LYYDNTTGNAEGEITLFSEDGLSLTCTNCYTVLTLSLEVELNTYWDWITPHISKFSVVTEGSWKTNVDLLLNAEGSWSESGSFEAADIELPEIEFFIGWIPVWIDMDLPVTVGYAADVAADAQVTAGFDFEAEAEYGIEYQEEGGWSPIQNENTAAHVHNPTFSQQVDVTASAYILPQFNIDLYGIAGPFLNLQPGIDGVFDEKNEQFCVNIGDDLSVNIGAEIVWPIDKSMTYNLYSFNDNLYDQCQ